MAIHAHSTTAPARRLLPRRGPDGRFARPVAAQVEPTPASADEVLDDRARELDRQGVPREPLLPEPAPLQPMSSVLARRRELFGAVTASDFAEEEIGCSARDANALSPDSDAEEITPAPLPSLGAALSRRRVIFGAVTLAEAEPFDASANLAAAFDPAFAAVRAFDRVVAEWDAEFAEYLGIMDALDPAGRRCWDDPRAVARAVLGPIAGSTVAALDRLLRRMEALDARREAAEARLLSTRATSEIGAVALQAAVRRYARRPFGWWGDEAIMLAQLPA